MSGVVAKMKETWVEIWKRPEEEVTFTPELRKKNAHARRSPYRVLPSDFNKPLDVDPYAFDSILRVYQGGLEVGTVRGEFASNKSNGRFYAILCFAMTAFIVLFVISALVDHDFLFSLGILLIAYFPFCTGMVFWRAAYHQPPDDPVLFDRKNNMVYIRPYIMGGSSSSGKRPHMGLPLRIAGTTRSAHAFTAMSTIVVLAWCHRDSSWVCLPSGRAQSTRWNI